MKLSLTGLKEQPRTDARATAELTGFSAFSQQLT
jgi:hypothetical protein